MSQLIPKKKALHTPWYHFIFSLRRVSLTEYFIVLRALFPLFLQMARCTMDIASTVCTLQWVTTRTKGMVAPYVLPDVFVGHDYLPALYLN
jgi:hypothetical protein